LRFFACGGSAANAGGYVIVLTILKPRELQTMLASVVLLARYAT